ncbi:sensor histidine kinase [Chenggangzhangella methanolivorans]|uniref:histidine kinase n=1 Tax=Chenggangzhangella methanolivorans TaxID=1437009 RepID=A0A9E6R6L3_9HYPH|nr:PAS domain-containing protein [Chenggangzhangella methanolivorans]QZN99182.1 PAS domain S-box protein [Chenggangzhangella methanolivorans]
MSTGTPPDAMTTEAGTLAQESAGRPAFVIDADGAVVWAGPLARRLIDAGGLESASAATLVRLAASGAATMARLRFGALGRAAPLVVRTRPAVLDEGRTVLVVEALSEIDPTVEFELDDPDAGDEPAVTAPDASVGRAEVEVRAVDAPPVDDAPEPNESNAEPEPEPLTAAAEVEAPAAFQAPADEDLAGVRFVFEIDADGRLGFLSPDLADAVGPSASAAVGRLWRETARALALDPDGAVERSREAGEGWSDVSIAWPLEDGRRLPLSLSALPMYDRDRALVGFRGLGRAASAPVAEPQEPVVSPDEEAAVSPGFSEGASVEAIEAGMASQDAELAVLDDLESAAGPAEPQGPDESAVAEDVAVAEEPPISDEAVVSDPPPVARLLGRNVVTLRETAPPLLTTSEESAFDEIARRLRDVGVRTSSSPYGDDGEQAPWTINDVEARLAVGARADELLRLLDRLPAGALALKRGAVVYANRHALELLGHPDLTSLAERDAGTLFAEPLPREDDAAPAALRLVASDGAEVEAEARLSAIFWEGEPATLVSLKRAEGASAAAREAIEREKETAAILDTATDGVLTLDGAGRILSANRSAEALFGFEAQEVIGSLFTLSLAPESRKAAFDYLDRMRANGVAAVMNDGREVLGLVRQGGAIPLYMTIGRIGAHESDRFCAVLRDVTPWKKAEEELLAAKRQAERASAQKSEFLTKVSHEIRTPLNAIIGFAEVMMEERFGPVGSPRYKDYLRDIHVSGGHLVGLVNDLVDIARIESGGIKLEPSPVDLNEVAAQAATLLQPQASRDHVIIRVSQARGLPPVMADRRSVRQIMTTLTANAVKLSRPGGQVIVATAMTDLGQAAIRVRDAGAGMSKQEVAAALEPFRPLGSGGEAKGLALPLAKALAEANDAAFTLTSEPGQGTLAEVVFPAAKVLAG